MLRRILIIDKNGDLLVEKILQFTDEKIDLEPLIYCIKGNPHPPAYFESFGTVFIIHQEKFVYICGEVDSESPNMLFCSQFLVDISKKISSLMVNGLNTNTIKRDYPLIYEILDQSIDTGFPFIDELSILTASFNGSNVDSLCPNTDIPWRSISQNTLQSEFLVDIIEYIDCKVAENGRIDQHVIRGSVNVVSKLQGEQKVGISVTSPNPFEETCFHRCVDAKQHLAKRFTFVPPNERFTLISYMTAPITSLPVFITPKFHLSPVAIAFDVHIRVDATASRGASDIIVIFPLLAGAQAPSLAPSIGEAHFSTASHEVEWKIGSISAGNSAVLRGSASVPPGAEVDGGAFARCKFVCQGFSSSGIVIDCVTFNGVQSRVSSGIRVSSRAGFYDFACVVD